VAIGTNAGVAISHDSGATGSSSIRIGRRVFQYRFLSLRIPATTLLWMLSFRSSLEIPADNPTYRVEVCRIHRTRKERDNNQTLSDDRSDAVRDIWYLTVSDTTALNNRLWRRYGAPCRINRDEVEDRPNRASRIHLRAWIIYDVIYQAGNIIDVVGALGTPLH